MSVLTRLMGSTVTIVRYGTTSRDRLNNPVRGVVSRTSVRARLVQDTTEERDDSDVVIDKWRGYFPHGTDLRSSDRVLHEGREFLVEGTPAFESVPGIPAANHVSVALRRVEALK